MIHRNGRLYLTDPGGPKYTAKTFSDRRYEILFCNSYGHSVPVINGKLQPTGSEYYGTLAVENMDGVGEKDIEIDMTHAYPPGIVRNLHRTLRLDSNKNTVRIVDKFAFDETPESVEEAFITYEGVTVHANGGTVAIGPSDDAVILSAGVDTTGRFSVDVLEEESKEGRTDQVVKRIRFIPDKLATAMDLSFDIR